MYREAWQFIPARYFIRAEAHLPDEHGRDGNCHEDGQGVKSGNIAPPVFVLTLKCTRCVVASKARTIGYQLTQCACVSFLLGSGDWAVRPKRRALQSIPPHGFETIAFPPQSLFFPIDIAAVKRLHYGFMFCYNSALSATTSPIPVGDPWTRAFAVFLKLAGSSAK